MTGSIDLVVIGGGLGGLTAAAMAAKAGLSVVLLEKASEPGGRAATTEKHGFALNLGAHALYRGGPAVAALDALGVAYPGREPPVAGGFAALGDGLHTLPTGFLSLVSTDVCGLTAKLDFAKLLGTVGWIDAAALDGVSVTAWLDRALRTAEAKALVSAFLRVSTYSGDLDRLSAGAAVAQLQHVYKHNVLYLDGGWQTLVRGLRRAAEAAGVTIRTGARVTAVATMDDTVNGVILADGTRIAASAVIVAASPAAASALLPASAILAGYARDLLPVRVACLDVALRSLPAPRATFALGVDRPLYASVHTATAKLAPEGGAVIHLLHYAPEGDARADEAELTALLDRLQPGWREVLVEKRFLPSMIASNALPTAAMGGLAGRPGVEVPGVSGLYLAGDWVGPKGLLADAVFASASACADLVSERLALPRAA
ncbi:MAG: FAD-dependent oxidoreductase [Byssovorax sp.]